MKILLYSANFAPEPTGIGKYSGEMAAWLATQGHQVRVVAAPPYYPAWQLGAGYAWPPYRREEWQGVDVWRAPLWVPRNPGGLLRVVHLLTFALSSLPVMLIQAFWRPNVVMTVAPALVCAPVGWLTARFCGARAWLHIQDFEIDVAFQAGLLKGKAMQRLALTSERWLLRRFDVVSTISRKMMARLATKGVTPEKISFFPNWVDIDHVRPLTKPSSYRAELGIAPDAVVMLFSGTLGNKQGLMVIPDAARRLMHMPGVVFVVCGDGVMKPELEAAANDLPNLKLLPLQPFTRLSELLGLADLHLLTQSADAEDLVLPSKLTGMLASGRPVIATCNAGTEIAGVVQHCGRVVAPGDDAALALAVVQLVNDVATRLRLGTQARAYAETNLARDSVLGRLVKKMASNSL
ncbi:MAG: glycosyltransferase WbuB [Thiobacillus sp.]